MQVLGWRATYVIIAFLGGTIPSVALPQGLATTPPNGIVEPERPPEDIVDSLACYMTRDALDLLDVLRTSQITAKKINGRIKRVDIKPHQSFFLDRDPYLYLLDLATRKIVAGNSTPTYRVTYPKEDSINPDYVDLRRARERAVETIKQAILDKLHPGSTAAARTIKQFQDEFDKKCTSNGGTNANRTPYSEWLTKRREIERLQPH